MSSILGGLGIEGISEAVAEEVQGEQREREEKGGESN
jgi:hypothetical protein